jgi:cytochrome bd ubiquinol oxidase subunit II
MMEELMLQQIWYGVFILLIIAYIILDGFDLGVGCIHLFLKKDLERRILLSAIGPLWDGNSVWLVIIGGALFAGFPEAYATIFSVFYIPFMILLSGLIFRTVSIEFRSKRPSKLWRSFWDGMFSISSIVITFSLGVTLGNFVVGVPLDVNFEAKADLLSHLNVYSIIIGFTALFLFSLHGCLFLMMKTEEHFHDRLRLWAMRLAAGFVFMFVLTTQMTWISHPYMMEISKGLEKELVAITMLNTALIMGIFHFIYHNRPRIAFSLSCMLMAFLVLVYAIGTYPVLLRSSTDPDNNSLTIFNATASPLTLKILLLIVVIGAPFAILYTLHTYKTFRGKVNKDNLVY